MHRLLTHVLNCMLQKAVLRLDSALVVCCGLLAKWLRVSGSQAHLVRRNAPDAGSLRAGFCGRRWSGLTSLRVTSASMVAANVHVIAVDTLTVDSLGYEITSQYFDSRCVFFRRLRVRVRAGARECTNCTFFPLCKRGERLSLLARYAVSVSARDRLLMNIQ